MQCPRCNYENPPHAKFCLECGTPLGRIHEGGKLAAAYRDLERTLTEARRLGLTGWVRNRADGAVEVTAEGPRALLEQLLAYLHHGPPAARVTEVQPDWLPALGKFRRFEVR